MKDVVGALSYTLRGDFIMFVNNSGHYNPCIQKVQTFEVFLMQRLVKTEHHLAFFIRGYRIYVKINVLGILAKKYLL